MNGGDSKSVSDVVIVGAGPAGMMLALLLARRGISVKVIERNPDFTREFRGEVLQPRFWRGVAEVGLTDVLAAIPHEKFNALRLFIGSRLCGLIPVPFIDAVYPYITWMTQPDMLEGLRQYASRYKEFTIEFGASVKEICRSGTAVTGIRYQNAQGQIVEHSSKIVVGCDGRFSKIRKLGDFRIAHASHQFDVIWFEMNRPETYTHGADFFLGRHFNCIVLPKYPHKIQCGILIPPGSFKLFRDAGAENLARELNLVHPMFQVFSRDLVNFKSFTLLEAVVERVGEWAQDGMLLIGDAAHTCSPAGAIGVTIAVESAIVADEVIARCVTTRDFTRESLGEVQRRREPEVLRVHKVQERVGSIVSARFVPVWFISVFIRFMVKSGLAPRMIRGILTRNTALTGGH